mgnify:FL=1
MYFDGLRVLCRKRAIVHNEILLLYVVDTILCIFLLDKTFHINRIPLVPIEVLKYVFEGNVYTYEFMTQMDWYNKHNS